MRVIVAMLIASAGCTSTHRSTLPPYVRDIRLAQEGGLEVISCEVIYTVVEERGPYANADKTRLEHGPCWRVVVPTAVQR